MKLYSQTTNSPHCPKQQAWVGKKPLYCVSIKSFSFSEYRFSDTIEGQHLALATISTLLLNVCARIALNRQNTYNKYGSSCAICVAERKYLQRVFTAEPQRLFWVQHLIFYKHFLLFSSFFAVLKTVLESRLKLVFGLPMTLREKHRPHISVWARDSRSYKIK